MSNTALDILQNGLLFGDSFSSGSNGAALLQPTFLLAFDWQLNSRLGEHSLASCYSQCAAAMWYWEFYSPCQRADALPPLPSGERQTDETESWPLFKWGWTGAVQSEPAAAINIFPASESYPKMPKMISVICLVMLLPEGEVCVLFSLKCSSVFLRHGIKPGIFHPSGSHSWGSLRPEAPEGFDGELFQRPAACRRHRQCSQRHPADHPLSD